ncbi:MAG TPA: NAD(P)H-dependent oxidoreductase [Pseudolysinimonas sp.]|nr:NAD(P)H-dependent oxidoreductase [Pseudolysinimonas sp.]
MSIVIGNPKLGSRTRKAAELVYSALRGTEPTHAIELVELGPGLLGWGDPAVKNAVEQVQSSSFVIFASPTFKATYTGLLKLFLDQFSGGTGLHDVVAVPLMLGADSQHQLATEVHLKPVLAELGAITTSPGLFLRDTTFETDGSIEAYAERWAPAIQDAVAGAQGRRA